jgi:hypothetical protein
MFGAHVCSVSGVGSSRVRLHGYALGGKRASDGDVCSIAEADSCSFININIVGFG